MYDFAAHLAAVIAHLTQEFPSVPTIEEYPRLRKKIAAPAILVELADATPQDDVGTGQICLTARFEARVVFDLAPNGGSNPSLQALSLASAVAQQIFAASRFGQPAGPAKGIRLEPDQFKPDLAGYAVWLIEWTHDVRLGKSAWDGEGILPSDIYVGYSPEIGLPHEDDYVKIGGSA